jgi:signal transduction histidine kinase
VHRHAEAQAIEIAANCADGKIVMTISDNGKGIPEETVRRYRSGLASGVGLAGMRERLKELNGLLEIEPAPRGTVVRAIIPAAQCNR